MFCTEDIQKGSVIEICPVIIIPGEQARLIMREHILYSYYFEWNKDSIALALGYGSLYNHAEKPNAFFEINPGEEQIVFKAERRIRAGEEILVDYHAGNPGAELWFDVE
jgi:SET domain-containing protein